MLMVASAAGDPSNIDVFGPGESIPEWRLVPHDNNIGQRNVHQVPAAGGVDGILAVLDGRTFTVHNPFDHPARMHVDIHLPRSLAERRWAVEIATAGGSNFTLGPRGSRRVRLRAVAGTNVTPGELGQASDLEIVVMVTADDILMGGMVYTLDPTRSKPLPQDGCPKQPGKGSDGDDPCRDQASELLKCLALPEAKVKRVRIKSVQVHVDLNDC
jgi:hypothetical protein